MQTYSFTAFGMTRWFQGVNPVEAMAKANKVFPLGAGTWMNTRGGPIYRWVEGNFSD